MRHPGRTETEAVVVAIVTDLIQDWGLLLEEQVSGNSLLVADLEFASVDIIQLCVAIEQHFARKLGFQDLLMEGGSYVSDLSIAQVAAFIDNRLGTSGGAQE
jgi:acyl carrier protein